MIDKIQRDSYLSRLPQPRGALMNLQNGALYMYISRGMMPFGYVRVLIECFGCALFLESCFEFGVAVMFVLSWLYFPAAEV